MGHISAAGLWCLVWSPGVMIPVLVVDVLPRLQLTPQMLLHHLTVDPHALLGPISVIPGPEQVSMIADRRTVLLVCH